MIRYIDEHKDQFGVEAICRVLRPAVREFVTARGYRAAKTRPPSARALKDELLAPEIARLHTENYGVYGVRKMHALMRRQGWEVGRDQTASTINTGLTIRGMDLAAGSAIAAATAVASAVEAKDVSQQKLSMYEKELAASFVGADMRTYGRAPEFLENPRMYGEYGHLLADVMHDIYNLDLSPRRRVVSVARGAMRRSGISLARLARDGWGAARAL